jgi:hypothetical protein
VDQIQELMAVCHKSPDAIIAYMDNIIKLSVMLRKSKKF